MQLKCSPLQDVDISSNFLNDAAVLFLAECLAKNRTIKSVNFGKFSKECSQEPTQPFCRNQKFIPIFHLSLPMLLLYLGENVIGPDGASKLANSLKRNCTLEILDLYKNKLGK